MPILPQIFFELPALSLAPRLLGTILCRRYEDQLWQCRIIETEAYTLTDKASHSYRKRKGSESMFAPAGTIYMYRIRQWNSLNISASEKGAGVLIKSAVPHFDKLSQARWLSPYRQTRPIRRSLSGQGLLCAALKLSVADWNGKQFNHSFYLAAASHPPREILVTPRLGVTANQHLPYRFVDRGLIRSSTLPHSKLLWKKRDLVRSCRNAREATRFAQLFTAA